MNGKQKLTIEENGIVVSTVWERFLTIIFTFTQTALVKSNT